jgi:hypothetical protein
MARVVARELTHCIRYLADSIKFGPGKVPQRVEVEVIYHGADTIGETLAEDSVVNRKRSSTEGRKRHTKPRAASKIVPAFTLGRAPSFPVQEVRMSMAHLGIG